MAQLAQLDTLVGGGMLVLSLIFLGYGIRSGVKNRHVLTGKTHSGIYVFMGFALLAMGIMVFLLGVFRPTA